MKIRPRAVVNRVKLLDGLDRDARWQETRRKLQPVLDDGDDRPCVVTIRLQRAIDQIRADGLCVQKGPENLTIAVPAHGSVTDKELVEVVYNWVWGVLDKDEVDELEQLVKDNGPADAMLSRIRQWRAL
jgi:hypothetical protein